MKDRIVIFLKTYFLFVALFVLQKPLFMACYPSIYTDVSCWDWLLTMWHGLPLDFSLAGYLTALPGLMLLASAWTLSHVLRRVWNGYFLLIACLLSLVLVVDLALYGYWGFRLDATPLFYFFSSPRDAVASVSWWFVLGGVLAWVGCTFLFAWTFRKLLLSKQGFQRLKLPFQALPVSLVLLLLTGLLFIPIRGGFTVSTMNTGKVYFSSNLRLNHAATNPAFNLLESLSKQKNFAKQYRFMGADEADRAFTAMLDSQVLADTLSVSSGAPVDELFTMRRPDVMLVILESFSSRLMTTLGGEPGIAIHLDSLAQEGVLFTNFFANSFRTDRGLVAIMSGYPAQPTTSIMKYSRKTQHLPAIASSLRKAGYATQYYYGGDADFTNMRSYLMSSGIEDIVCDRDFPVSERLSKWGAHDHVLFNRLITDLEHEAQMMEQTGRKPFYRVVQTSSSHEPFEVPYRRLENDRLNAFAYTDSCVADFVHRFRELPQWKNTVLILVPDHLGAYPEQLDNFSLERYRIPLLMIGGAVRQPRCIDVYGSQQDLAATLLAQLGLPHDEFTFSKDMLNPDSPHFAFFTVPDAFGMVTSDGQVIYDNQAGRVVWEAGEAAGENLLKGKAYLQKLYDDLASR
ncbi:MAG: sulfatase-like hydrolase/transferase [Bacteroides sp.]|nr:sulfatase-like hydrolase/transferase [Bacteroides sp.]